jgi:hypothetical protein
MAPGTIESEFGREGSAMSERGDRLARGIRSFVENPVTNLVKGVVLLLIGISDASHTFRDDVAHGHVRVGHGLVIIGLFSILGALPHLIEGLGAAARYIEFRNREDRAKRGANGP